MVVTRACHVFGFRVLLDLLMSLALGFQLAFSSVLFYCFSRPSHEFGFRVSVGLPNEFGLWVLLGHVMCLASGFKLALS